MLHSGTVILCSTLLVGFICLGSVCPSTQLWSILDHCYGDSTFTHAHISNHSAAEVFEPYLAFVRLAYDQWLIEKRLIEQPDTVEYLPSILFEEKSFENSVAPVFELHCRYVINDYMRCMQNCSEEITLIRSRISRWSERYCTDGQVKPGIMEDLKNNYLAIFGAIFDNTRPDQNDSEYFTTLKRCGGSYRFALQTLTDILQSSRDVKAKYDLAINYLQSYALCSASLYQMMYGVAPEISLTLNRHLNMILAGQNDRYFFSHQDAEELHSLSFYGSSRIHLDGLSHAKGVCVLRRSRAPKSEPIGYISNQYSTLLVNHEEPARRSTERGYISEVNILFWSTEQDDSIDNEVFVSIFPDTTHGLLYEIGPRNNKTRLLIDLVDVRGVRVFTVYDKISSTFYAVAFNRSALHVTIEIPKYLMHSSVGRLITGCEKEANKRTTGEFCLDVCSSETEGFLQSSCHYDCTTSHYGDSHSAAESASFHDNLLKQFTNRGMAQVDSGSSASTLIHTTWLIIITHVFT